LGWYQSELLRRTDPAGRTVGRFLADEIATPLGLDLHIGLPPDVNRDRVAHLHQWKRSEILLHLNVMRPGFVVAALNPLGLSARATNVPSDVKPWDGDYNRDEVRAVEMPSSNGIGTARAVAEFYGSAATGGADIGLSKDVLDQLTAPAVAPSGGTRDRVLNVDVQFSLGFSKPLPNVHFGSSDKAFGTPGFGGSFGFADPDTGVGFGYVMNRLGFHLVSDPRELALRQAVFRDVLGVRPQS
jgi:CubicO group peptidase (beta-lactamase class C family)